MTDEPTTMTQDNSNRTPRSKMGVARCRKDND